MPFTPFHFGPGLALKAAAPRRISFAAFAAANVLIDFESLYHLVRGDYPVHGPAHSLLGATTLGLGAGAATFLIGRGLSRLLAPGASRRLAVLPSMLRVEIAPLAALLGGSLGGASHPILDAIVHRDVLPFAPWSPANPLLGALGPGTLAAVLAGTGLLGAAAIALRLWVSRRAG